MSGVEWSSNMRTANAANAFWRIDREVARLAVVGLVAGIAGSLAVDFVKMQGRAAPSVEATADATELAPPVRKPAGAAASDTSRMEESAGRFATAYDKMLAAPMTFTPAGSVLLAEGSIGTGSAGELAVALATYPHVTRISLNSRGGALDEAMAMAKLVRERGLATEIADGAICASSCPLFFVGGQIRTAAPKALLAVHQFYAASEAISAPAEALADAQMTAARISRHLVEMDIEPAVWLHALDTPPQALYRFSPDELVKYHLVTSPFATAPDSGVAKPG